MSKYILPFLFILAIPFGLNLSQTIRLNNSFSVIPIITPTPSERNDSVKLTLDKTLMCQPCLPGSRQMAGSNCTDEMKIDVIAGKAGSNSNCEYIISGGRIVGAGAKVVWDITRRITRNLSDQG